ncbi:ABC-F family ATP-binding cassette domain-containing protein [Lacticaseibacillus rhamnosus]|uniref:ABC-F family ATP-binding cassette domain-containing protein n=1 Tax=Lacticaseibacillus rhamnosus TaxID=47715 RepID=UPI0007E2775F|nr:ATP-binding cassette domain-containing protein [Lacticaseibacillus rhamnosus]MCZ2733468.1 ATP-binding cassette domain-containing protein [Lacticaseibacillus rhamnosus]MCZ2736059.1 ATP-binding cassette domain-containing protein [Lacticaseibacillus rhamnosus]MCZ2742417.1 ATP-binding cassette domain-containing protein [Lacticaseibacillus rhamnosus]MCZ2745252.1 ATP-binding cassette domain-containing protein [Lacticaseibacillus rhamnosus]MCZ2747847.1 ATP-binding cassette domain-containing protei
MLTVNNVSMTFSDRKLYEDVNLKFTPGNCYGIIGANGAGKSTFLKILEGELTPTTGTVSLSPNERMSSLKQDHFAFDDQTVMNTVLQGWVRLYQVMTEKDALYAKPDFSEADGNKAAELEGEFAEMDGWNAESDASQLLQSLGISESEHQKLMADLPEGEKIKVLLAQALFGKPDVLLLDEPTNGLDPQAISWLEDFLADYEHTVLVVSHDRHFLNAVCTMMCDVDFGKIELYVGNYDFWKQSSELALQLQSQANAKKEEQIKQLQEFVARFSANASKSKQATSRKKQLEKITLDDIRPSSRKYPYIKFEPERAIGNDLLRVENVSKTIDGQPVLQNVSFILRPGDKTGIISRNDVTATVLMQLLAGELEPDSGTITWGVTTSRAAMPKDLNPEFDHPELNILDWLRQFAPQEEQDNTFLRGFLGRMLFSGDEVLKQLNVLSGGEKVRSYLAKMMLSKANVLIMDDPTNHLDLESITSLNDALIDFTGSLIFTSHDHQFIQTIADHIIEVGPLGVVDRADTSYDEFMQHETAQAQVAAIYPASEH